VRRRTSSARGRALGRSVLLVDIGNTRIKWALWRDGGLTRMQAAFHGGWSRGDYERHLFRRARPSGVRSRRNRAASRRAARPLQPTQVIVASVAGARVNRLLAAAAGRACGIRPRFIATSRRAAGVTTRYTETWRLGVDRFAGVIGARSLLGAAGACVINAGTAVTIDLLDAQGVHRGGAILPGPRLMVSSLLDGTAGIGRRAREKTGKRPKEGGWRAGLFARSTRAAIEEGARYAVASAVDRAAMEARRVLGRTPKVLLTGGGADELERLIQARHARVPDLVLRGIAAQAELPLRTPRGRAPRARAAAADSAKGAAPA
jgi:type III pantothenate kinase